MLIVYNCIDLEICRVYTHTKNIIITVRPIKCDDE